MLTLFSYIFVSQYFYQTLIRSSYCVTRGILTSSLVSQLSMMIEIAAIIQLLASCFLKQAKEHCFLNKQSLKLAFAVSMTVRMESSMYRLLIRHKI